MHQYLQRMLYSLSSSAIGRQKPNTNTTRAATKGRIKKWQQCEYNITRNYNAASSEKQKGKKHPRNSFQGSYDMEHLVSAYPPLGPHIIQPPKESERLPTISFGDSDAVRALNTAILVADYGVHPSYSDILPSDNLVPPVPGRADYIHYIADVLQQSKGPKSSSTAANDGACNVPKGTSIVGLDIGTGASCIYPTIAASVHGWKMIASETNLTSIDSAQKIVKANKHDKLIDIRHQPNPKSVFHGMLKRQERIDFCMCNPPYYPSLEAFQNENARKMKGLARGGANRKKSMHEKRRLEKQFLNKSTSAIDSELWCPGGEVRFVRNIISESYRYWDKCLWFTSLVSRKENLSKIEQSLVDNKKKSFHTAQIQSIRRLSVETGANKKATILMWSFFDEGRQRDWANDRRWGG